MPDSEILKIIVSVKDQATGAISNITNSLSGLQKAAIMAGSALGAIAVKKTIDAFASFDDALQKSIAIMGDVDEAMREKLANTAREVAKELGISHEEAARSYYYLASAGLSATEALKAMPAVAKLAKAGALDMAEATDIATDIMTAFGKEVEDLANINDILIATVTKSNTNLQMLGEAMKYLAPSAHAVGWSIEEMSAAVGLLSNAGIKASQAGTYLRQIIAQLLDPTKSAIDMFEKLGLTVEDMNPQANSLADILQKLKERGASASDIMQIFGVRAGTAVLALMDQGVPALREFTEELKNAGGITEQVAETQMESFREQMNKIKAQIQDIMITIGEQLAPILEDFATKLREFFADEKTQEQMKTFTEGLKQGLSLIIDALKLTLDLLSKLPPEAGKAVGAFAAFGMVIGPVMGVVSVLSTLWGSISGLISAAGGLSGALSGLSGVFATVAGAISLPVVAIVGLIAAIGLLVFNVGGARDKLKSILSTIKDHFITAFNKAKATITNFASIIYNKAKEIGISIVNGIKSGLSNLVNILKNALTNPVKNAIDKIKGILGIGSPSKVFAEIGQSIVEGYKRGIATARDLTPKLPLPTIEPPLLTPSKVTPAPVSSPAIGTVTINIDLHGSVIREEADIDRLVTEIERRVARRLR